MNSSRRFVLWLSALLELFDKGGVPAGLQAGLEVIQHGGGIQGEESIQRQGETGKVRALKRMLIWPLGAVLVPFEQKPVVQWFRLILRLGPC